MLENIKDLKKKEKWLRTLYEITRDVTSTLSLKQCLRTITEKVTQLLGVKMTSLMLLDKETRELSIECAIGLSEEIIKATKIRLGKDITVSGWVAEKGRPLLINDVVKDGRFPLRNISRYNTKSLLSVPLKVKGKVIGVLNVNNKIQKEPFTTDDLDLLCAFADEAAIAIENSKLFEELMQVNRKLMEINKLKSEFIASLSHRLRTPLVTSKYFTSILRDELRSNLSDQQKEYLFTVEDNISRLDRLVNNLLDLAKIESGKTILNRKSLSIVDIARKAVAQFQVLACDRNIALRTYFASRFPKIYLDEEKILEVFNILIDNAIKFTPSGGRISIQIRKRKELAEVSVKDTGAGIAKKDLDRLFIKFSQLSSTAQAGVKGSGLGLAISKEIIEMHKGRICAESQLGKGSSFIFTLPLYKPLEFFIERLGERIREAEENGYSLSLIILVIENFNRIKKKFGNRQSLELLKDLERIAKETVRRPEDEIMMVKNNCLVVFCKADKAGGYILGKRLKRALAKHKFPTSKSAINLSIHFEVFNYPEDGLNEEQLTRKTRSLITRS